MTCTRNVADLIQKAYRKIGIYSDDRNLDGDKACLGLDTLNELLDEFATSDPLIAYFNTLQFNLIPNQREYVLSKAVPYDVESNRIIKLKWMILNYSNLNYPIRIREDIDFYQVHRNTDVKTIPFEVFLQNTIDEKSKLFFFQIPDKDYECTVKAKFVIEKFNSLSDPITNVPAYYYRFLQYAVAHALKDDFTANTWDEGKQRTYDNLKCNIEKASDIDLSPITTPTLTQPFDSRMYYWDWWYGF